MPASAIPIRPSEVEAARLALEWARPGDAIVLLIHSSSARGKVLDLLRAQNGG
jgi:hypothetical protein